MSSKFIFKKILLRLIRQNIKLLDSRFFKTSITQTIGPIMQTYPKPRALLGFFYDSSFNEHHKDLNFS